MKLILVLLLFPVLLQSQIIQDSNVDNNTKSLFEFSNDLLNTEKYNPAKFRVFTNNLISKTYLITGKIENIVSNEDENYITMFYQKNSNKTITFSFYFSKPEEIMNLNFGQYISVKSILKICSEDKIYFYTYDFEFANSVIIDTELINNQEEKLVHEIAIAEAAAAVAHAESKAFQDQLNNDWGDGNGNNNDGTSGDAGDPNGVNDGGDGWGTDGDGDGVWGLGGRSWAKKPVMDNKSQNFGKVTLKIKVDNQGNIISAEFTNYKSTTTNSYLIDLAIREVKRQGKITSNVNAPSEQWGYVTINFRAQ